MTDTCQSGTSPSEKRTATYSPSPVRSGGLYSPVPAATDWRCLLASVCPNGVVLTDTCLLEQFWDSAFTFYALAKLFEDAPALLVTWKQITQSDEQVIKAREGKDWKGAWDIVAASMIIAHTGDRHAAQRAALKPQGHMYQQPDRTVQDTCTLHLEHVQKEHILGIWDGVATFLIDVR